MRDQSSRHLRRALPVVLLVLGAVTAVLLFNKRAPHAESQVTSLAVLPFTIEAAEPGAGFLAAGLSADLRYRLQSVEDLQCIPHLEVLARTLGGQDWRQLALQLGAEILISGKLRESSGKVQIAIEILDTRDGKLIRSSTLEESRDRILDLHRRLAREVIADLPVALTREQQARIDQQATRSLKAWEAFAQGTGYLDDMVNPRAPIFAAELLHRAVELDPDFFLARSHLSAALWLEFMSVGNPDRLRESELQARRALEDRPDMSLATVALVLAIQTRTMGQGDHSTVLAELSSLPKPDEADRELASSWLRVGELELAESAFLAAIESAPDYWLNPYGYGRFLLRGGRHDEAERAFSRASEITPVSVEWPQEVIVALRLANGDLSGAVEMFETIRGPQTGLERVKQMATAYSILGRLEPAETLYRQAIDLAPHDFMLRQDLGDVLARSGRSTEANDEYVRALAMLESDVEADPSDPNRQRFLALSAAKAGDCARASPLASTLLRHLPQSAEAAHDLARVFAICNEREMALQALTEAIRIGLSPELVRSRPEFEWLSTSTDFEQILAAAETPPPSP